MTDYSAVEKKRKKRQLISAAFFIFILIAGWFWPLLGYFIPFCMILGLGIGIFKGRVWCNWLCPRGSFYDSSIKPLSSRASLPPLFRHQRLRIAIFCLLMLILISNLIFYWPNPYSVGRFFVTLLSVTTVLGIILGIIFHQRAWCFICPVGSLISWIGGRKKPLKIISSLCTECSLCQKSCPMQIAPFKFRKEDIETVNDPDCLKCGLCQAICPKKALSDGN